MKLLIGWDKCFSPGHLVSVAAHLWNLPVVINALTKIFSMLTIVTLFQIRELDKLWPRATLVS